MANFKLVKKLELLNVSTGQTYVGKLDGKRAQSLSSFLIEIAKTFDFPDYYGENLDAFDECINDMDWIDNNYYFLLIDNYNSFLSTKKEDKYYLLKRFEEIANEWRNVPNFEGEEKFRHKAIFEIYIELSEEVLFDLNNCGITFDIILKNENRILFKLICY